MFRRPAPHTVLRVGPFRGVTDTHDPLTATPERLLAARNAVFPDPVRGAAVVQRRGFLGAATARNGQGQAVYTHRRLDGTVQRYVFAGGKMYRWDGATTYTDVTPVGVTIHASNPIFVTPYFDELVVTDGANQPFIFTPADGTADLIQAFADSRLWNAQGPAVVYGGSLVFILKAYGVGYGTAAQNAITWCEPGDARVGYQQTDYDFVWELTQTSAESLTCLVADEGALVYFRQNSIGFLTGNPTQPDFRAAATRDTISATIGTDCPAAVVNVNRSVFFPDLDGKLHRLVIGGGPPEPMWMPMRRTVETKRQTVARSAIVTAARGAYYEAEHVVLMTIWDATTIYVFHAETGDYLGTWTLNGIDDAAGESIHALGGSLDSAGLDTFLIVGTRGAGATTGIVWRQKTSSDASPWLDTPTDGVATHTAFEWYVDTPAVMSDPLRHFRADEVRAQIVDAAIGQTFGLRYTASGAAAASAELEASTTATADAIDIAHATWGLGDDAQGTALRFRLRRVSAPSTAWGLQQLAVKAVVTRSDPDGY